MKTVNITVNSTIKYYNFLRDYYTTTATTTTTTTTTTANFTSTDFNSTDSNYTESADPYPGWKCVSTKTVSVVRGEYFTIIPQYWSLNSFRFSALFGRVFGRYCLL